MSFLLKTFLLGVVAIVPLLLTISILWWVVVSAETLFRTILEFALPEEFYLPGLGIILAVTSIFGIGLLTRSSFVKYKFSKFEDMICTIPVVKTIYGSLRDFFQFFFNKQKKFSKVALVSTPESDHKLVGFITSENPEEFLGKSAKDHVGVYLPMSYQIGGYTVFVPKEQIKTVDTNVEDTLRYILTAGVSHSKTQKKPDLT